MSKFKPNPRAGAAIADPVRPSRLSPKSWLKRPPAGEDVPSPEKKLDSETGLSAALIAAVKNPLRKTALKFTLAFLFLRFSFIHEFISAKLGIDSHLLIVFGAVAYFATFIAGGFLRGFQEKSTWMWFGFLVCMALATAMSIWRGGSFAVFSPYIRTTFPLVLLIPAVAYTTDDIRKMINTIGIAGVVVIGIGFVLGGSAEGRLDIESPGASIGNANDYAAHLIFVLPAIIFVLFARERSGIIKLLGIPVVGAALYLILHTGSRGGLVGIIVAVVYAMFKGSGKVRAGLLIGIPVLGLLSIPLLPHDTVLRLESLFSSQDEPGEAVASQEQRQALFWASVNATLAHPLLGVGPGCFQIYQGDVAGEHGERGMWHETHNAYTQISSENGIPAFLLFLFAIIVTGRALQKASKSDLPHVRSLGSVMLIMMVGYGACIVFLSQAYAFNLLAMTGLANALKGDADSQGAIDQIAAVA